MQITLDEAQLREAVTEYLKDCGVTVEPAEIKFIAGRGPNSGHRAEITLSRIGRRAPAQQATPAAQEPVKKTEPEAATETAPERKTFVQVSEERGEEPAAGARKEHSEEEIQAALKRAQELAQEDQDDDPPWDEEDVPMGTVEEPELPKYTPDAKVPIAATPVEEEPEQPSRVEETKAKEHKPGSLGSRLFNKPEETKAQPTPRARKSLFDK